MSIYTLGVDTVTGMVLNRDMNESSTTTHRYPVLDAERSGTLYFLTAAGRDAYIATHRYAIAVPGSPASRHDVLVNR